METPAQPLEYRRVEPMLTKGERRILMHIKMLHEHPPTTMGLLKKGMPRLILSLAMVAGGAAFGWFLRVDWFVPFCCGAAYVAVIARVRHIRLMCKSWPTQERVMNWDEVDRLLAPSHKPAD